MKIGERFVPYHVFDGKFIDVVSNIDVLTRSEKRLLIVLNSYCYKNGKCYPSQATISRHMGSKKFGGPGRDMSVRQVQRVQGALVAKGFLVVERPGLIDRHLLCKTNRYFFVWNEVYSQFLKTPEVSFEKTPEMSPEPPIIDINQQVHIQQNPAAADSSMDDFEEEIRTDISTLTNAIADMLPDGHKFDPFEFASWAESRYPVYPLEAVRVSLDAIRKRILSSGSGGEIWGYGVRVIQTQGPALCAEAEHLEARAMSDRLGEWVRSLSPSSPMGLAIGAISRGSSL